MHSGEKVGTTQLVDERAAIAWRRYTAFALAAVLVLSVFGCGGAARAPLPPEPPTVLIRMDEMTFDHPAKLPRGRVVIRAHNAGNVPHRLVLVPLPKEFPPIRQQVMGPERRVIEPQAGIATQPPAATGTFALDLVPGRYGLICYVLDPDGKTHAAKGMASEFRVL